MARVGQYKALGTKLGGYKSTLSKIESKEYGKKHADWKAAEEISLYNQIGGTVANVIGIAQESRLAREQADMYAREFGIDPGDKFAKRVTKEGKEQNPWLKLSEEAQDEAFWADENMSDKVVGLPETPDSQSSLFEGEPGETSPISRQNISGGIADTETAYQESLKNFSPSPRKSVHQLESESLRSNFKEQDYDTMGGRTGATAYKEISTSTPTIMSQNPNVYGMENEALRNANSPYLQNPDDYKPSGVSPTFLPNEVTDNTAFNAVSDPLLGDLDTSVKSSSVEQAMLNKFGKSGASKDKLDELIDVIGTVESGNQNIAQIGGGPGRGIFQFETGEGKGMHTALNRIKRMYTEKKHLGQDTYPSWIDDASNPNHENYLDATKLSPSQQRELLIADLYMKAGSDEYLKTAFSSGNYKDLWLESHWAGADEDKESKSAYYDSVMTKNKRRKY